MRFTAMSEAEVAAKAGGEIQEHWQGVMSTVSCAEILLNACIWQAKENQQVLLIL